VIRTQKQHLAVAGLDDPHAAQDESAHEELAELGIVLHDASQLLRIDQ
jgi:hypothetical protein